VTGTNNEFAPKTRCHPNSGPKRGFG